MAHEDDLDSSTAVMEKPSNPSSGRARRGRSKAPANASGLTQSAGPIVLSAKEVQRVEEIQRAADEELEARPAEGR
jgi:hypothetical protein